MWLFTADGFFSAVIDKMKPGRMLIRARCEKDIKNFTSEGKTRRTKAKLTRKSGRRCTGCRSKRQSFGRNEFSTLYSDDAWAKRIVA